MRCYRKLRSISYSDHTTNKEGCKQIQDAIGFHDGLFTMVKKRKLRWYDHISYLCGMAKTILQGTVEETRRRSWQKTRWEDKIKDCTGLNPFTSEFLKWTFPFLYLGTLIVANRDVNKKQEQNCKQYRP